MAKNKNTDLNDHLYAQVERLNDETIKPEKMKVEVEKAKAMSLLAKQILEIQKVETEKARLFLDAFEMGAIQKADVERGIGIN